jgi:hypothetical protein
MSFLDAMTCGFGAVILFFMIISANVDLRSEEVLEDRSAEVADGFWERVVELAQDFSKLPRSGDDVHGFVAAIYRADRGKLP